MNDLKDLLKHEIYDLYSAEEQIIKALPAMIEKANNPQLKTALQQHVEITQNHLNRLNEVQGLLNEDEVSATNEKKGLLARLFKRNHVCKGMQGLIDEGQKIMAEEMSPEVLDAAVIACVQKIEHYEICGYGTARAFARELNLTETVQLLEATLNEEYEADDRLTEMAVGRINQKAERASNGETRSIDSKPATGRQFRNQTSSIKEPEMELVAERKKADNSKKSAPGTKNRAPKGESERSETKREIASERQVVGSNKNSKPSKSSSRRKATDGRTNGTKRSQ